MSITLSYNSAGEVVKIEEPYKIISTGKNMKRVQNIVPKSGDTVVTQTQVVQDIQNIPV